MPCDKRRNIIKNSLSNHLERYTEVYEELHQFPGLSRQEERAATIVGEYLEESGWRVEYGIGGHGVVGVLHNSPGATVLLRSELDALPITEKTDLLEINSTKWSGTLIAIFQPNAERLLGAQAMVNECLFRKIPYPSICLAQHCVPTKSGTISVKSGRVLGYLDSLDLAVDPILPAASIIEKLQIIAREMDPKEPVVIRCTEFHGSTDATTIPEYADFKVDVRSFSETTQKLALEAVKLLIHEKCLVFGSPTAARIVTTVSCPATDNDEEATGRFIQTLKEYYGDRASEVVQEMSPDIIADDFPLLAQDFFGQNPIPYIYWNIGSTDPKLWDKANRKGRLHDLTPLHNAEYAPAIKPTLRTGIEALALAALTFLTLT
ncbi:Amidohydrolase [Penicillium herquei]|nr:Amidohydrolase [Penicillium herquei]